MKLRPPFFISSHLAPALRIGDGTLSLIGTQYMGDEQWGNTKVQGRTRCNFVLEAPGITHVDDTLTTGAASDWSTVQIFEAFLSFMEACGEGVAYEERNPGSKSENSGLFPPDVAQWLRENLDEIGMARCDICDPEDGCTPLHHLIEE